MTVSGGVIITGPGKGCLRNGGGRIEYQTQKDAGPHLTAQTKMDSGTGQGMHK